MHTIHDLAEARPKAEFRGCAGVFRSPGPFVGPAGPAPLIGPAAPGPRRGLGIRIGGK
jgi:hypothetical protein